ncbi:unnamed protein product [Vitrella brassicaformis CCMP3155]|uniref:Protein kinase domain-containing protein n=1 Tax=Vitrella brassicaformis (strain CCMP3155) TaxID=1169540 RepID=A0A0G4EG39_VITBC|nr:unnamed protein product [Vitrella brassicaformis CCMP3155]|mmetsp:Transcript_42642/g.120980  ORF Transcript_42642/g.120980 Transcript_42642/m.120980 type:complete len:566 (-) Transcript_42642:1731-3428(-)|eukprot:CEL95491.1 unnamed protein product [Vitrella brassicaformis CCMP3155]
MSGLGGGVRVDLPEGQAMTVTEEDAFAAEDLKNGPGSTTQSAFYMSPHSSQPLEPDVLRSQIVSAPQPSNAHNISTSLPPAAPTPPTPAVLTLQDGHHATWPDDEVGWLGHGTRASVRRGVLQPPYEGQGIGRDAAFKIGWLADMEARLQQKVAREFEVEGARLRALGGNSPFLSLLAVNTNRRRPAIYTNTEGIQAEALCVAMTPLGEDWVEVGRLFGWTGVSEMQRAYSLMEALQRLEEGAYSDEAIAAFVDEVTVITRALYLICLAHIAAVKRGILHFDAFVNNVMVRWDALLSRNAPLTLDDVRLLDLANTIAIRPKIRPPGPSLHPPDGHAPTPPAFMGTRAALVPLLDDRKEAERQIPDSTRWLSPPELAALCRGVPDVPVPPPAASEAAPSGKKRRAWDGMARLGGKLRAEGVLLGEGDSRAMWVGQPTLVWAFGMLSHMAMRSDCPDSTVFDIHGVDNDNDRRTQESVVQLHERLMVAEWDDHHSRLMTPTGQPLDHLGSLASPIEQLRGQSGFEWAGPWADTLGTISERALRSAQQDRGTLEEIRVELLNALSILP